MFQTTVSIGDVIVVLTALATVIANFFATTSRIDRIDYKVEELRRGRGLILEHWPYIVRKCFGYEHNGGAPTQ